MRFTESTPKGLAKADREYIKIYGDYQNVGSSLGKTLGSKDPLDYVLITYHLAIWGIGQNAKKNNDKINPVTNTLKIKINEITQSHYENEPDRRRARSIELAVHDLTAHAEPSKQASRMVLKDPNYFNVWRNNWTPQIRTPEAQKTS